MPRSRKAINLQKRKQFDHQNGLCCWCLLPMDGPRGKWCNTTWEHIIPLSMGGKNSLANKVLAHRECNNVRGVLLRTPRFWSYTFAGK